MTDVSPKVEVMASVQRRRRWSAAEKMRMVEATYAPAASMSSVARQHGVKVGPSDIALAMSLLLYTVQRPSDVRHMTAGQVREMHDRLWLVLRQEKTNELVAVPRHRALEGPLRSRLADIQSAEEPVQEHARRASQRSSLLLVPGPDGRAWTQRSFATAWDRALRRANRQIARDALRGQPLPKPKRARQREAAKRAIRARLLSGLQRRDIRRTGMVQLALAGATIPQIAALSGQSIEETYVPRRADIALAGVEAWELRERDVPSSLAEDLKRSPGSNEHSPNQNQQKNAAQQATNSKTADLTGI